MADPINLPTGIGYESFEITPHVMQNVSRMDGRRVETAQFGTPWWSASFTTPFLGLDQCALMDGWLIQAAAVDVTFLVYDIFRPRPVDMDTGSPLNGTKHVGGGPFTGSCNIVSIPNSRTIEIDGLPTTFTFSVGDYIEIKKSNLIRSLHRLDADVSASAGAATLTFRHGLDTGTFSASDSCELEKPSCVMQMDGLPSAPKGLVGKRVSFQAQEVFYQ
jgi:hypothetical protein